MKSLKCIGLSTLGIVGIGTMRISVKAELMSPILNALDTIFQTS